MCTGLRRSDYEQLRLCRGLELVIVGIARVSTRELRQGKRPVPKCLAYPESNALWTTTAQLILAMSYLQMHQYREAVPKMIEAQERIDTEFANGLDPNPSNDPEHHWYDWALARILLRECQEQVLQTDRSLAQATLPPASLASSRYRALGEWHALRKDGAMRLSGSARS